MKYIDRFELATKMANRSGVLKKDCLKLIDIMIAEFVIALKNGDGIHIQKFGKFEYYVRGQKRRLDRETGEVIPVPPVTRVKFTPCKDVKYGVQLGLDWENYLSDAQRNISKWYQDMLTERENNESN